MKTKTLEKLLNEACELLTIYEDSGFASEQDLQRINALFNEIKYSDEVDEEISHRCADEEAQDWEVFGEGKI